MSRGETKGGTLDGWVRVASFADRAGAEPVDSNTPFPPFGISDGTLIGITYGSLMFPECDPEEFVMAGASGSVGIGSGCEDVGKRDEAVRDNQYWPNAISRMRAILAVKTAHACLLNQSTSI